MTAADASVAAAFARLRAAQPGWAATPVSDRLAVLRRLRRLVAAESRDFARSALRPAMGEADILVAEVTPLLAACRFLEKHAAGLLADRRGLGARPLWLAGTRLRVRRIPFGVILILGPRNFPLMLTGVQVLQALAAGNGVALKPAPGWAAPMRKLAEALDRAGLPPGLLQLLPDTLEAGSAALRAGPDKVVLTGGLETGRRVLAQLARVPTPATMELSGDDAMIVLPGASLDIAAAAIAYGLTLNGGETCIAPRRIIAVGDDAAGLAERLDTLLRQAPLKPLAAEEAARLLPAVAAIEAAGGRLLGDRAALGQASMRPLVAIPAGAAALPVPLFAAAASLLWVADTAAAITLANAGAQALGAAVFGPTKAAEEVARQLRAGSVVVNDLIVPTADPRAGFGGAGASGFGVTRGPEGLLEMTRLQTILTRSRPVGVHYRPLSENAAKWIARGLRVLYG
jgi:acyl-CoA reductase-like NAD-dependent aldehyde dehydrogenase